jgi:hypothetical protein
MVAAFLGEFLLTEVLVSCRTGPLRVGRPLCGFLTLFGLPEAGLLFWFIE